MIRCTSVLLVRVLQRDRSNMGRGLLGRQHTWLQRLRSPLIELLRRIRKTGSMAHSLSGSLKSRAANHAASNLRLVTWDLPLAHGVSPRVQRPKNAKFWYLKARGVVQPTLQRRVWEKFPLLLSCFVCGPSQLNGATPQWWWSFQLPKLSCKHPHKHTQKPCRPNLNTQTYSQN